jgi:hypothetical protein
MFLIETRELLSPPNGTRTRMFVTAAWQRSIEEPALLSDQFQCHPKSDDVLPQLILPPRIQQPTNINAIAKARPIVCRTDNYATVLQRTGSRFVRRASLVVHQRKRDVLAEARLERNHNPRALVRSESNQRIVAAPRRLTGHRSDKPSGDNTTRLRASRFSRCARKLLPDKVARQSGPSQKA